MRETLFSPDQIKRILDQSLIYMCACPAQLCRQISSIKGLYDYQGKCLNRNDTDRLVHQRIAETAQRIHAELEACLQEVLTLEGWNMETLEMPANLQKKMFDE